MKFFAHNIYKYNEAGFIDEVRSYNKQGKIIKFEKAYYEKYL